LKAEGNISKGLVQGDPFIKMEGQAVFKFAVKVLSSVVEEVLEENQLQGSDIDWLVPHQANIRIMEATAKKLGLSMDNVIVTFADPRQHLGGVDSFSPGYRGTRWPHQGRAEYFTGGRGWRVHLGRGADSLVVT